MQHQTIPLFPLGIVLVPKMPLPLHIFEERYKTMIGECLESGQEFGIVYTSGSRMQEIGCTATVKRVMNRYDDGRMDILAFGKRRFYLNGVLEGNAYQQGKVEFFDDERTEDPAELSDLVENVVNRLEVFAHMTGNKIDRDLLSALTVDELSFIVTTASFFTAEERQHILGLRSSRQRLETEITSLEESIARRHAIREIQRVIGSEADVAHLLN